MLCVARCATCIGLLVALVQPAAAEVISFGTQSVDELSLAGPQTEGSFQYVATGLGWDLVNDARFGNPPASLATVFNGNGPTIGDKVDFTLVSGGLFTFDSVDFQTRFSSNSHDVTLRGFRNGSQVGALLLNNSTLTYQTVTSGISAPLDLLRVEYSGTPLGNALFLDNLRVSPIPEPATLAALLGMVWLRRSRRDRVAVTL